MQTKKSVYRFSHFFFRSVTFFSLIWKNFSFSHISYLCLKVLYLERNFSRCTHQAHTVFYFQLWGIFKSAFFDQKSHMCLVCAHTFFSFEGVIRQYHMYILVQNNWHRITSWWCSQYPEIFASLFLLIFKKRRILLEKNTKILKNGVSSFYPFKTAYFDEYEVILLFDYI